MREEHTQERILEKIVDVTVKEEIAGVIELGPQQCSHDESHMYRTGEQSIDVQGSQHFKVCGEVVRLIPRERVQHRNFEPIIHLLVLKLWVERWVPWPPERQGREVCTQARHFQLLVRGRNKGAVRSMSLQPTCLRLEVRVVFRQAFRRVQSLHSFLGHSAWPMCLGWHGVCLGRQGPFLAVFKQFQVVRMPILACSLHYVPFHPLRS